MEKQENGSPSQTTRFLPGRAGRQPFYFHRQVPRTALQRGLEVRMASDVFSPAAPSGRVPQATISTSSGIARSEHPISDRGERIETALNAVCQRKFESRTKANPQGYPNTEIPPGWIEFCSLILSLLTASAPGGSSNALGTHRAYPYFSHGKRPLPLSRDPAFGVPFGGGLTGSDHDRALFHNV